MRILLTNDDGVGSAGIESLRKELATSHTLCTVAPDRQRSGTSHATTFTEEVVFRKLEVDLYSCTGTPADCVLFSLLGAVDFVNVNIPEVVSGGCKITVTRPSQQTYDFELVEREFGGDGRAFGLRGAAHCLQNGGNTDWEAIEGGVISISPVNLHPINHSGNELRYTDRIGVITSKNRSVGLE